jgi:hypothetical protein
VSREPAGGRGGIRNPSTGGFFGADLEGLIRDVMSTYGEVPPDKGAEVPVLRWKVPARLPFEVPSRLLPSTKELPRGLQRPLRCQRWSRWCPLRWALRW